MSSMENCLLLSGLFRCLVSEMHTTKCAEELYLFVISRRCSVLALIVHHSDNNFTELAREACALEGSELKIKNNK